MACLPAVWRGSPGETINNPHQLEVSLLQAMINSGGMEASSSAKLDIYRAITTVGPELQSGRSCRGGQTASSLFSIVLCAMCLL